MNDAMGVNETLNRGGNATPANNSMTNPLSTLSNAKKTTLSGKCLLLSPRGRSNSLMGAKNALMAYPNPADVNESNNDGADHFHVAGKRYKRKRPRVDDMAYQASVSSYREHPTTQARSYEEKMALLEESCVWKGAKGGTGASVNQVNIGRYLQISKGLSKPLYSVYHDIKKGVTSNSLLENETALQILHRSKYNVNHAALCLASSVGAGQEVRHLRKNYIEQERSRRGVRSGNPQTSRKNDGSGSRLSKSKLSDKEVKRLWAAWNAKARHLLNHDGSKDDNIAFGDLKKVLLESKQLPEVTLIPGSTHESFLKSAISYQKKLEDRISLVNQWTARAHDLLSGENRQLHDIEDLKKLLQDAKSVKNLLEDTDYIQALVDEICDWVATYKNMLASSTESGAVRIEAFQSLLKRSSHFPVRVVEVQDLKMRLDEAAAQGVRIRRLFPEFWQFQTSNRHRLVDKRSLEGKKPDLKVVEELVEQVESVGIQTDELAIVKDALNSTHKWIQRVEDLTTQSKNSSNVENTKQEKGSSSSRKTLKTFSALLQESKHLPIDVSMFSSKLAKALSDATTWVKKFKDALPKQNKTRGGEGLRKAKLDTLTTLLDEAGDFLMMDNNNKNKGVVEDIKELVETAQEWMEDAKKAIGDKTTTESELRSLYVEGNDIPVEMNLLKLVETEIKRRDWTSRANAYISNEPFQKLPVLKELLREIPAIRALLPEDVVAEDYRIAKERDIKLLVEHASKWMIRAEAVLKPVGRGAPSKKQGPITSESVAQLIDDGQNLTVDLREQLKKLQNLKSEAATLQQKVNKLAENIEKVLAHRSTNPIFPVPHSEKNAASSVSCASSNSSTGNGFIAIELKVLEKVLDEAKKTRVQVTNTAAIEKELEAASSWISQAKQCSLKQQRNKSRPSRKPTKQEIIDLCYKANTIATDTRNELGLILKDMEMAEIFIKKADDLIAQSDKDMEEILRSEGNRSPGGSEKANQQSGDTNIFRGDVVTVEEEYLELFQQLIEESRTGVAFSTPQVKLLNKRVHILKWLRSVAPLLQEDCSGSIQEVSISISLIKPCV